MPFAWLVLALVARSSGLGLNITVGNGACSTADAHADVTIAGQWQPRAPYFSATDLAANVTPSPPYTQVSDEWLRTACAFREPPHDCGTHSAEAALRSAALAARRLEPVAGCTLGDALAAVRANETAAILAALRRAKRLSFAGDSISRQHFIEVACSVIDEVTDASLVWRGDTFSTCPSDTSYRSERIAWASPRNGRRCQISSASATLRSGETLEYVGENPAGGLNRSDLGVHVINVGAHHSTPAEHQRTVKRIITAIATAIREAHSAKRSAPLVVWRETTPAHFMRLGPDDNGSWKRPERDDAEQARRCDGKSKYCCRPLDAATAARQNWRNRVANPLLRAAGVPVFATYDALVPQWDAHVNFPRRKDPFQIDCLHFCSPGVLSELWVGPFFLWLGQYLTLPDRPGRF